MKIGLLTTSFPRYPGDVAGCFVLGFARTLVELGHGVEVLAPEPAEGASPPEWRDISLRWVRYMRPRRLARTFYGAGAPDNLRSDPLAWLGPAPFTLALTCAARKARSGWDAIVSHWALPCALAAGLVREHRPHVAVFHSADVHLLRVLPARGLIARRIAAQADKLVFVAPGLRDLFLDWLPAPDRSEAAERCRVFPMGIEPVPPPSADRQALREKNGFDRFTLLFVGRLVPVKGVEDTIYALSQRRDVELVVAGEGPERPALERLAREREAPVRFLGEVIGSRKHDLLRAADAFISPSRVLGRGRTEGVPTSLIEAMAHGLPIIATDVGGVGSVLGHMRSAILVPPADPAALGASVNLLVRDSALRDRLSAHGARLGGELIWPALAGRIESLLST